jgi:hypothetical protein
MQVINSKEIKRLAKARDIIDDNQRRIWRLEQALDDLARACEIAMYSQQYSVTDVYRQEAEKLLEDRLTLPEGEQSPLKIQIVTGEIDAELQKQITEKSKIAAGVDA